MTGSVAYPGGVESDHQLAGFEGVDDVFNQFHVVLNKPVGFEADIAEGNLRSDMDSSVVSKTSGAEILKKTEKFDCDILVIYLHH